LPFQLFIAYLGFITNTLILRREYAYAKDFEGRLRVLMDPNKD
jgi:hypothetical protein